MKIFLTGGTGFVGSHFLRQGLAQNHEIVALRRSEQSRPRILLTQEPKWLDKTITEVEAGDLAGCTCLVHLAAHTANVPYDTLENCILHNVIDPLKLFRVAVAAGIKRFVVAGSCFEYGKAGERYEFIPPDAPLEPTQSYSASKAMASIAFTQFATEQGLSLSIHRIFQAYGEGEAAGRLWPSLVEAALAGRDFKLTPAEQVRDFVPVEQVAADLLHALALVVRPGEVLVENIGTGREQRLRDFVEMVWRQYGGVGALRFGERAYCAGEVMRYVPLVKNA